MALFTLTRAIASTSWSANHHSLTPEREVGAVETRCKMDRSQSPILRRLLASEQAHSHDVHGPSPPNQRKLVCGMHLLSR